MCNPKLDAWSGEIQDGGKKILRQPAKSYRRKAISKETTTTASAAKYLFFYFQVFFLPFVDGEKEKKMPQMF